MVQGPDLSDGVDVHYLLPSQCNSVGSMKKGHVL